MKRTLNIFVALIMVLCIFTGCASNMDVGMNKSDMAITEGYDGGWFDAPAEDMEWIVEDDVVYDEMEMESPMAPDSSNPSADEVKQSDRKIIKNKSMDVQTTDLDAFISELKKQVSAMGGYVENSSNYKSSADFTVRIPADNYDAFSTVVGNLGTVTFENEYIDDVTSQYIDIEARLTALRSEQESYLRLMERAETVEEILQIQSYLSNVNYQIESYTAQLNAMKSKISYSTIRLSIVEVVRVADVTEKPTVWQRITSRLSNNLYDIGEDVTDFFVDVVSSLPYIAIWAIFILIAIVIVKICVKKHKNKKASLANQAKIEKSETEAEK